MPRRIHPFLSYAEKRAQVLAAFRRLHAEGFDDCGPTDLAREINLPWARVRGLPAHGAVRPFILALMDEGLVRRRPQGVIRGRYKLIEAI